MKTVGFILKRDTENAIKTATSVADALVARGVTVLVAADGPKLGAATALPPVELAHKSDAVIVVGGDGTFLAAARHLYGSDTPVIGINLGRVGFLTEVELNNVDNLVERLLSGAYKLEERPYFTATFNLNGQEVTEPFLNDAVIQRDTQDKMMGYAVDVGPRYMTSGKADGLIIATPTGSTAYNLSTGGPIVYPTLASLVLAPIAPHKLSFRPVVIPPEEVTITLKTPQAHISLDGRSAGTLSAGEKLTIRLAGHSLKLLHDPRRNFFDLLRLKLGWDLPTGLQ